MIIITVGICLGWPISFFSSSTRKENEESSLLPTQRSVRAGSFVIDREREPFVSQGKRARERKKGCQDLLETVGGIKSWLLFLLVVGAGEIALGLMAPHPFRMRQEGGLYTLPRWIKHWNMVDRKKKKSLLPGCSKQLFQSDLFLLICLEWHMMRPAASNRCDGNEEKKREKEDNSLSGVAVSARARLLMTRVVVVVVRQYKSPLRDSWLLSFSYISPCCLLEIFTKGQGRRRTETLDLRVRNARLVVSLSFSPNERAALNLSLSLDFRTKRIEYC